MYLSTVPRPTAICRDSAAIITLQESRGGAKEPLASRQLGFTVDYVMYQDFCSVAQRKFEPSRPYKQKS